MATLKSKNYFYNPSSYRWIFIFVLLALSFVYGYHKILFLRPQSVHQWRQCDCLSLTSCYYQDGNSLLEPAIHNLGEGSGKAVGEFPLLYYLVAQLWKIFGPHEFIYRLLVILIAFSGLFALFRLTEDLLKDSLWSLILVSLLFTSPLLVYYTNNFLVNVPAFALQLIAFYFFKKFYDSGQTKFLLLFTLLFILAGLLKITAVFNFIPVLVIFVIDYFRILKFKNNIFQNPRVQLPILLLFPLFLLFWVLYSSEYNRRYNDSIFLTTVLPIWNLSTAEIHNVFLAIMDNAKWNYFRPATEILTVLFFIVLLVMRRTVDKFLLSLIALLAICFFTFIILFFQNLNLHDYYMIDFLLLVAAILITFFHWLKENHWKVFNSTLVRLLAVAFVIHNADFARRRIEGRYDSASYLNKNRSEFTYAFENISPYLRSIGIKKGDKVISFPDGSPTITLYLMNQKGWTNYNLPMDSMMIREKISKGAKYLFIYDKKLYHNPNLQPFLKDKVGSYLVVDIFRL